MFSHNLCLYANIWAISYRNFLIWQLAYSFRWCEREPREKLLQNNKSCLQNHLEFTELPEHHICLLKNYHIPLFLGVSSKTAKSPGLETKNGLQISSIPHSADVIKKTVFLLLSFFGFCSIILKNCLAIVLRNRG